MPTPAFEDKHSLRSFVRLQRRQRSGESGEQLLAQLLALPEFQESLNTGSVIGCYLSLPHEPSTRRLRDYLHSVGARVVVPRVVDVATMEWCWDVITDEPRTGIPEPTGALADTQPALLIIPALAIDNNGFRLGQGGGYFDRLSSHAPRIALIFDHELIAEVPREAHDLPVDMAITPLRTVRFPSHRGA